MTPTRIVIFAKAPVPGHAKTRLIPALGAQGAADLARAMLRDTLREALSADVGPVELCLAGHPEWDRDPRPNVEVTDQGDGDLGDRLWRATARSGPPLLLIGTDCPALDRRRLKEAAARLGEHDAVLHPAEDGGYALLGLNRLDRSLFTNIAWSTDTVARETIARIAALGWSLHVGEILRDIDEPADLAHHRHSRFRGNDGKDRCEMMKKLPPYAELLGLSTRRAESGELLWIMPFREQVVGRPGYLHGGAIAGLLEFAALGTLHDALGPGEEVTVKPINVTVDFMRGGIDHETYATAVVTRLGKRVANVEAHAWQQDRAKPIAAAHMNLLLRRS